MNEQKVSQKCYAGKKIDQIIMANYRDILSWLHLAVVAGYFYSDLQLVVSFKIAFFRFNFLFYLQLIFDAVIKLFTKFL